MEDSAQLRGVGLGLEKVELEESYATCVPMERHIARMLGLGVGGCGVTGVPPTEGVTW